MVVLDTSTLLFWTLAPQRLSGPARSAIDNASELLVNSISLWEIGVKAAKGKLELPLPVREYSDKLAAVDRVQILDVDLQTWLLNIELDWDHRDPADRTIVATAIMRDCPLVSSDSKILEFYPNAIW